MKRIYPENFPKQTECRLDRKYDGMGRETYLLIDFTDETVLFIPTFGVRTLTESYKECQYFMRSGLDIDTYIPAYCGRYEFKRFENIRYK